jgi:hypothetical protein
MSIEGLDRVDVAMHLFCERVPLAQLPGWSFEATMRAKRLTEEVNSDPEIRIDVLEWRYPDKEKRHYCLKVADLKSKTVMIYNTVRGGGFSCPSRAFGSGSGQHLRNESHGENQVIVLLLTEKYIVPC